MKKLFILLAFLFPINIFASSYTLMDLASGRVLYSNDSQKKRLIASTTKVMTCIIALEKNKDLQKSVKVGEEVLKMYGTNIYVEVGEKMRLIDLLYGLMLRSGNDAAVVLAKYSASSEENFVRLMNEKAKSLGMKNTTFNNPHGLDEETKNYSTAEDMAILARYAFSNKMFRKIISTKKYRCKSSLKSYLWYNRVSILNNYKYSRGGKNGYTPKAGKTLVSYATKDNHTLLCVSLGDADIYSSQEYLFNKAFREYKLYKIVDKSTFNYKNYYIKKSFYYPLKENEKDRITTIVEQSHISPNIIIKYDNATIGRIPIYIHQPQKKKQATSFKKCLTFIKNLIFGKD